MKKTLSSGFPTRSDTTRAVQAQKMARDMQISDLEGRRIVLSTRVVPVSRRLFL